MDWLPGGEAARVVAETWLRRVRGVRSSIRARENQGSTELMSDG